MIPATISSTIRVGRRVASTTRVASVAVAPRHAPRTAPSSTGAGVGGDERAVVVVGPVAGEPGREHLGRGPQVHDVVRPHRARRRRGSKGAAAAAPRRPPAPGSRARRPAPRPRGGAARRRRRRPRSHAPCGRFALRSATSLSTNGRPSAGHEQSTDGGLARRHEPDEHDVARCEVLPSHDRPSAVPRSSRRSNQVGRMQSTPYAGRAPSFDRFTVHARAPCPGFASRPKTAPRSSPASTKRSPAASSRSARSAASSKPRSPSGIGTQHAVAVSSGTERARDHPARRSTSRAARSSSRPTRSSRPPPPRSTPARASCFVDCDPETMAFDLADVAARLGARHRGRRRGAHRRPHQPGAPRARAAVPRPRRAPRRGRRPRARQRARRTQRRHVRHRGRVLLLPDQGHRRRRGRHDRHRRRGDRREPRTRTATRARDRSSPTSTRAWARTGA